MIIDKDEFIKAFKSKVIMYLYEDAVNKASTDSLRGARIQAIFCCMRCI